MTADNRAGEDPKPTHFRDRPWTVRGRVNCDGAPLVGALIRAFDRELRSEYLLGEAVTDADGHYEIHYDGGRYPSGEKPGANLVVRVGDGETPLISSAVVYRAQAVETVDLICPNVPDAERSVTELE